MNRLLSIRWRQSDRPVIAVIDVVAHVLGSAFWLAIAGAVPLFAVPAAAQTPQIAFDNNLVEGQKVTNTIRLIGFAITPLSAGYVEIFVDDRDMGRASYPLSRTDVPNSGFILPIDTVSFPNAVHTVKANSYNAQGTLVASATRHLNFANVLPRGAIEAPTSRQAIAGTFNITGWALADGGVTRLEVLIDGVLAGTANWGTARPDIAAQYPEFGIANSGFSASINLDQQGLAHGVHRLTLVALDANQTRRIVTESEFLYTGGRAGKNALEVPAQGAFVSTAGTLRVAGWTTGASPAAKVDVYINDRWAGSSTVVTTPRPDVVAAFPGTTNVGGFDFTVPGLFIGRGPQRIVAVVTDTAGLRANVDDQTGPVVFYPSDSDRLFGAQLRPANDYAASITKYTVESGTKPDIVMYFQSWRNADGTCGTFDEFPFLPDKVRDAGATVMVTWEPTNGVGFTQPDFSYASILAGKQDDCINAFAQQIKAYGNTVILRVAHEMNGASNTWTGVANGNDPKSYVDMFRKVVDMFRAAGALNAKFMWAPDHAASPDVPSPSSEMINYYPGTGYVDFIGVSGYNWANDPQRGGGWDTVHQIFDTFFSTVDREFRGKPIIIAEIGSAPGYASYSRSDWYKDTMAEMAARREVKGIVWFDDYAFALTTEPDFRITSTPDLPTVDPTDEATMKAQIAAYKSTHDVGMPALVSEFYAPSLNHYFRTAVPEEAASLRNNPSLGWQATGKDFLAYDRDVRPASTALVCRFYGSVTPGPNSHFYTADPAECSALKQLQVTTPATQPRWNFEENAFAIDVPSSGSCPSSSPISVYRAYNNGFAKNIDSNHRYTTDLAVYQDMIKLGWNGEGIVMCAPI